MQNVRLLVELAKRAQDSSLAELGRRSVGPAQQASANASANPSQIPVWLFIVGIVNVLLFVPVLVFISYTLYNVYPTLAIVEGPATQSYEQVPLKEDFDAHSYDKAASEKVKIPLILINDAEPKPVPITYSLKSITRALYGISGIPSLFRGLRSWGLLNLTRALVQVPFQRLAFGPSVVGQLVSAVLLVQLFTVWTHTVISMPSGLSFWKRLPSFKAASRATALPTAAFIFALAFTEYAELRLIDILGLPKTDMSTLFSPPRQRDSQDDLQKIVALLAVQLLLTCFLIIPSHVVLIRIQASILPEDMQTIVPFDRSFQTEDAQNRGYISMAEAWKSFSWSSWVNLIKLYVKAFGVAFAVQAAMAVLIVLQYIVVLVVLKH